MKWLQDTNACIRYLNAASPDLMIAAIAVANGLTLVTHNVSEFSRVRRLSWEDWELPDVAASEDR